MTGPSARGRLDFGASYPGGSASLNDARQAVAELVASSGASHESVERARLLVSELTTNAVEAAPGEPYDIAASVDHDVLTVEVRNRGDVGEIPPEDQWQPADALVARGRGLAIVRALADQVSIHALTGGQLAVTATLQLSP